MGVGTRNSAIREAWWFGVIEPLTSIFTDLGDILDDPTPVVDLDAWMEAKAPQVQRWMRALRVNAKATATWYGLTHWRFNSLSSLRPALTFLATLAEEHVDQTADEPEDEVLVAAIEEPPAADVEVSPPAAGPPTAAGPRSGTKPLAEARPAAPQPPKGSKPEPVVENVPVNVPEDGGSTAEPFEMGNVIWGCTGLLALATYAAWRRQTGSGYDPDDIGTITDGTIDGPF